MKGKQIMQTSNKPWKALYRVAGVTAILIILAGLTDALTSLGVEARDNSIISVIEWFTLFQTNRFAAFSRLGVINITTISLCIPIYLAFARAFWQARPARALLASALFFCGTAVYLSGNTVFALFALSQQYATAAEAHKPLLEAAGRALLAQGADLTPGTFVGLMFTQVAGLLITSLMLRGEVFGKWTGWLGLLGFSVMSVFFVLTAFVPGQYSTAMLIAAPGALLMISYQGLLARRFFQLGR
jgi:hypothetical protein